MEKLSYQYFNRRTFSKNKSMGLYFFIYTLFLSSFLPIVGLQLGIIFYFFSNLIFLFILFFLFMENKQTKIFNQYFSKNEFICLKSIPVCILQLIYSLFCQNRLGIFSITSIFVSFFQSLIVMYLVSRGYRRMLGVRNCKSETLESIVKLWHALNKNKLKID